MSTWFGTKVDRSIDPTPHTFNFVTHSFQITACRFKNLKQLTSNLNDAQPANGVAF
jgi:hypothetical protein